MTVGNKKRIFRTQEKRSIGFSWYELSIRSSPATLLFFKNL